MALRAMFAGFALAAAASVTGCSPYGGGAFACTSNDQCSGNGATGTCSGGFCSFADSTCASGLRYGDLSGAMSGACVGGPAQDGGLLDRPPGMDSSGGGDAPVTGDSLACYGNGLVHACFNQPPSGTKNYAANTTIDTGVAGTCDAIVGTAAFCVISAQTITINNGATLIAKGTLPLVLIATGTITINGMIDVGSHRPGTERLGAGADMSGCDAGTAPNQGGGGGAGGSLAAKGGNGGNTGHGTSGNALTISALRGGCPGQPAMNANGGLAGHGGGAVYLIASTSITIGATGSIDASGEGGGGASSNNNGGGGAGAGGMIGLEAPAVTSTGVVYANGGGGGEGASSNAGNDGHDATGASAAAGGTGGTGNGGDGGPGGAGGTATGGNGANGASGAGGGGGGGSVGVIKVVPTQTLGGMVSPPPS